MEADVVISLNGVNDLGFVHAIKGHPLMHPYVYTIARQLVYGGEPRFFPNIQQLLQGKGYLQNINLGIASSASPFQSWQYNITCMQALSEIQQNRYFCFLQPIMGYGPYNGNSNEKQMRYELGLRPDYMGNLKSFYEEASQYTATHEWLFDFTHIFEGESGVYEDARHQTKKGTKMMAAAIANELQRQGCFSPFLDGMSGGK